MKKKILWIVLITAASIFIDTAGKMIAVELNLPLWMDSLGTLIAAWCLGPVSGAIVGGTANIILGFSDPKTMAFVIIGIFIGGSAGVFARKRRFDTFFTSMIYAGLLSIFTTIASSIINLTVLEGETGNEWGNAVISFLKSVGMSRVPACLIGQFYLEFVDKIVTVAVFFLVLKAVNFIKKKGMRRTVKSAETLLVMLSLLSGLAALSPSVTAAAADKKDSSSVQNIYNESKGLTPGHATSLATTFDGTLWVGTYAGLYSYDGVGFTRFDSPEIKNVNCLYTDTEGRLWVGTNDNGISIIIDGELVNVVNSDNGLCTDSVRSIVQASDGTVYVGTSEYLQTLSLSNGISVTGDLKDLNYVHSSSCGSDRLTAAVTGDGGLYLIKDKKVIDFIRGTGDRGYSTVTFDGDRICAGTYSGDIDIYSVSGDRLNLEKTIDSDIESVVNQIIAESEGSFLVVCDNGLYRVEQDGDKKRISTDNFSYSLQRAAYDYQKNLWVASSRQGLLEISPSAYTDLFTSYNLKAKIVNAVMTDDGLIYAGCDDGLFAIKKSTGALVENALVKELKDVRIRDLAKDRSGNIYAASYSKGLISMDPAGNLTVFDGSDSQGLKARTVMVTSDGTVVSTGDNGICFIKKGSIQSLIPYGKELGEVSVLSVKEMGDGTIIATTDGNGYFAIQNGKIAEHFTRKDGLGSDVVLKAVPALREKTCFLVTSNGINVWEDGKIRQLSDFPYSNNYDILEDQQGRIFVTGSAGIYVTTEDDMLKNDGRNASLSGTPEGLPYNLTVNSRNYSDDQYLYLCGNSGIIRADMDRITDIVTPIRFYVRKISAGDRNYRVSDDYNVTIPGDSGKITLTPEVVNFALSEPVIAYRLKGYEKWHTVSPSDLSSISYTGLKAGKYTFEMEIRDMSQKVLEENSFTFRVSRELYERTYFRIYMILVLLLFIGWISWFFTHLFLVSREKKTQAALELARKQVQMGNESVLAMAKALFSKDRRTGEHCHRVAYYAEKLATAYGFSESETKNLKKAALLHDIGKIAIPDAVLNKPGKLTDEEYAIMKTHTLAGAEILKGFTIVDHVSEGARYHHERYDGKGYPEGIAGENIPLYGRIIAVCDTFDAMTANRVYRGALDMEQVMSELEKGRGTQFDPVLDDLFMDLVNSGEINPKKTFEMFQGRDLTEDIE